MRQKKTWMGQANRNSNVRSPVAVIVPVEVLARRLTLKASKLDAGLVEGHAPPVLVPVGGDLFPQRRLIMMVLSVYHSQAQGSLEWYHIKAHVPAVGVLPLLTWILLLRQLPLTMQHLV